MQAAFDRSYVKRLDAENMMGTIDKRAMLEAIREDINRSARRSRSTGS